MTQWPFGPHEPSDRRWREPRFTLWLKSYGWWLLYFIGIMGLATTPFWWRWWA